MLPNNPELVLAAAQRLKELEREICFDGTVPGSRPNAFQQKVIDDWGKVPTQAVTAGNQCLPGSTLVMTPQGPIRLDAIQVGQIVYDETGKEQVVVKTWKNGPKEIGDLTSRGRTLESCTAEHKWWTNQYSRETGELLGTSKVQAADFLSEHSVVRLSVRAPLGFLSEPHAYAIAALLGDGCSRQSGKSIQISSSDEAVPTKVAQLLGGTPRKLHDKNYTWNLGASYCNHYEDWCHKRYAHEKTVDLEVIKKWDRTSLLNFVAGLIDTDGSIYKAKDFVTFQLGMQALPVIRAFEYAVLALWNVSLSYNLDKRAKYKNGPLHTVYTRNVHEIRRILSELDEYTVKPSRKWQPEYEEIKGKRSRPDAIKLTWGSNRRVEETYDLTVSGPNNVYLLASGLVTSNSGKSALGARLAAWFLAENKPGWKRPARWGTGPITGLLVGRTMKQVEEELLKKLVSFFDPEELHIPKVGMVPQKVVHKKTGNTLLLASHHNESEAREKLQAFVLNFIWLDEMPRSMQLFEELERRVQSKEGWFISTFTPKVRNPEIRKMVDAYGPPYSKKYQMSMFANPILSEERKLKILKELEGYPESYRNCILEGDWMDDDLAVYSVPEHAIRAPQNYSTAWRHVEGADPALQSKHGQVVLAEEPGTGHWYVVQSDYVSGIFVPEDLIRAVTDKVKHLNITRRVCDAASTWYVGQAHKMGFSYVAPYDKNNRREEMMKNLQTSLGTRLFVAPWCQDLLNELGSMQWSETRADKVVNSRSYHLHDAFLYAADCLPKPEAQQLVPELHVRLRMQIEKDRKRESLKNSRVSIRRARWR